MKKIPWIILGVFSIYLLFVFCFSGVILSSPSFNRTIQGLTELFLRPRDLYTPLFIKDLDIAQKGRIVTIEFKNKYLGPHMLGLLLKTATKDILYKKIETSLKLKINFFSDGKMIFSKDIQNPITPFAADYYGGESFELFWYKCPEDLPLNTPITCKVEVLNSDARLIKEVGSASIFIGRFSSL